MGEITHAARWRKLGSSPDASPPRLLVSCEYTADASERAEMTVTLNTRNPYVLPPGPTLPEAIPILSRLVGDPGFLGSQVLPLSEEAARDEDWYVAYRHDDPERSYSLQVFVWPPGSATKVHDHSSWGAFCCVVGSLLEERYERADDGSLSGY